MKTILMFLYGDYSRDSRAKRSVSALENEYTITIADYNNFYNRNSGNRIFSLLFHFYKMFVYIFSVLKGTFNVYYKKPKIIWGNNNYSLLWLYFLKLLHYKACYIYDDYELYLPSEDYPLNMEYSFFYKLEKKLVNQMDLVICASEERADIMCEHFNMKSRPLVIRNISRLVIDESFLNSQVIYKITPFFLINKMTIVYAGVIGGRGLDLLIDAMNYLKDDYKLLIIGAGSSMFDGQLSLINGVNYLLLEALPHKCLGAILSKCDIGYVYYPTDTLNNIYCASNKVYEYASVGLPMLGNENPTLITMINKNNIGRTNNNIVAGIFDINNHYSELKMNCNTFVDNNKWEVEAGFLRNNINGLL